MAVGAQGLAHALAAVAVGRIFAGVDQLQLEAAQAVRTGVHRLAMARGKAVRGVVLAALESNPRLVRPRSAEHELQVAAAFVLRIERHRGLPLATHCLDEPVIRLEGRG